MHKLHAEVVVRDGFSPPTLTSRLVAFADAVQRGGTLRRIFLVHGEPPVQTALAAHCLTEVQAPAPGDRIVIG